MRRRITTDSDLIIDALKALDKDGLKAVIADPNAEPIWKLNAELILTKKLK